MGILKKALARVQMHFVNDDELKTVRYLPVIYASEWVIKLLELPVWKEEKIIFGK